MGKRLRLLLIEDSEADAVLVKRALCDHGYEVLSQRVQTEGEFRDHLKKAAWDLVITDYSLPKFNAADALEVFQAHHLDLPFIIVSGTIGEETAVASMKAGAHDFITKDRLARLGPAVDRELREAVVRQERRRAEESLVESNERLRALAARLENSREEERKRIARDIHDDLGSALTGLKMDLVWLRQSLAKLENSDRGPIMEKIAAMGKLLDATANQTRRLCSELRPGILDDLGLVPALEWQAQDFARRTGVACKVQANVAGIDLQPEQTTAIFRVFQEILTNVARHAKAKHVSVTLDEEDGELRLKASDDGCGMAEKAATAKRSLGLLGMRERVMTLGGTISFQSGSGKGTTVELTIPLTTLKREAMGQGGIPG
jgi:signal transduction histidine kinase